MMLLLDMKRLSWENSAHLHTASAAGREELAGFKREKDLQQQHHFSLHSVLFLQSSSSSTPLTVFLCLLEEEKEGLHFKRNNSVAFMPNGHGQTITRILQKWNIRVPAKDQAKQLANNYYYYHPREVVSCWLTHFTSTDSSSKLKIKQSNPKCLLI